VRGRYAWVVDGATGVSANHATPGLSDAAWLAGAISDQLNGLMSATGSAAEVFGRLEADISSAFNEVKSRSSGEGGDHAPSACLGFTCIRNSSEHGRLVLEGAFLGDVVGLVPTENGIVRWTDERAKPFEKRTLAALDAGAREIGRIPDAVRRQIIENRAKLNHPDGYWVVNPRRPWAGRELRFEARVVPGDPIVLATDGFLRLVDVFAAYSDKSLHAHLAAGKGDDLIRELRDLERGDPMADAYPRVKTHDDATVLVIAAEPYG
jgi:hypothetical protein